MTKNEVAAMIDHTQLKPSVSMSHIHEICMEAMQNHFATVAIHPAYIEYAAKVLEGSGVGITAALAFPYGSLSPEMKALEVKDAADKGATDCDFVINVGALKSKDYDVLRKEAELCRKASEGKIMKAILEVCLLTDEEIVTACKIYAEAGADFVKTSTGFIKPPKPETVKLMADAVKGTKTQVKAAGGIRNAEDARKMIEAGATRLGTSAGVQIINTWED